MGRGGGGVAFVSEKYWGIVRSETKYYKDILYIRRRLDIIRCYENRF